MSMKESALFSKLDRGGEKNLYYLKVHKITQQYKRKEYRPLLPQVWEREEDMSQ
jgi:hypothetical protein